MRTIVNFIRQCFCKHEFEYEEVMYKSSNDMGGSREGIKVSRTCRKCGWHKAYWKFG